MNDAKKGVAVIFGGGGFIGTFFARHILAHSGYSKVYLFDVYSPQDGDTAFNQEASANTYIQFIQGDVRERIDWMPPEPISLIANFAAVHREPGHQDHEYYECNLPGAENVCNWAVRVDCNRIIFTSSIAPYGPSEEVKDEHSIPVPETAYGGSKLAAEKIHQIWQAGDSNRQLVIVRPGVVFGPGEGGNVSRLIKAVLGGYFFYMGNKKTRKAGIYVKELCETMVWVLNSKKFKSEGFTLYNATMNPGPSIEEYVKEIKNVAGIRRYVPNLPSPILLMAAYLIELVAKPFGISHPFSPVRVKKLIRSNNIIPTYLAENEYKFKFTLEEALIDWKKECPEEWK
jgi:nucleoside-diphosphate-sugar epimerase